MSALADQLVEQSLYLPIEMRKLFLELAKEIRRLEREAQAAVVIREGSAIVAICPNCDEVRSAKRCPGPLCEGKELPFEAFPRDKRRRSGRSTYCRDCWREIHRHGGVEPARAAMSDALETSPDDEPQRARCG